MLAQPARGFTPNGWRTLAIAGTLASVVSACGTATGASIRAGQGPPSLTPRVTTTQVSAESCAAFAAAEQLARARVVLIGTMLPGPTLGFGPRRVLTSPARVRVRRYVKGGGPSIVRLETALTTSGNTVHASEDGIEPSRGQRWRIYSDSRRSPLATSICAGSTRIR